MRTSNKNKLVDSTKEKYEQPQVKTVQVKMENGIAADSATTSPNNSITTEWQQMPEASGDLDW